VYAARVASPLQFNPLTPFRNTTYGFQTFQIGIGGPCELFTPPAAYVRPLSEPAALVVLVLLLLLFWGLSAPSEGRASCCATANGLVTGPVGLAVDLMHACFGSYWCSNHTTGVEEGMFVMPSGIVINDTILPNSPYANPDGIVFQVLVWVDNKVAAKGRRWIAPHPCIHMFIIALLSRTPPCARPPAPTRVPGADTPMDKYTDTGTPISTRVA
jgi:hypothetical protein